MIERVTVSRRWNNPTITSRITIDELSLSMDMDNFVIALIEELGSVAFVFTRKEIDKRVRESVFKILDGIKFESSKVMVGIDEEGVISNEQEGD
jgi:hypothetical protein